MEKGQDLINNLSKYEELLKLKNGDELLDLEKQVEKIQQEMEHKSDFKLTTEKLVTIMKWKLKRGQFRPKLEQLAASNPSPKTQEAYKNALDILKSTKEVKADQVGQALQELTVLSGVGPATASKILSMMNENIPFMSDEALFMSGLSYQYTKPQYIKLYQKMNQKVQDLNKNNNNNGKNQWTVRSLEKAYWVEKQEPKLAHKRTQKNNEKTSKNNKKGKKKVDVIELSDSESENEQKNKLQPKQEISNNKKLRTKTK